MIAGLPWPAHIRKYFQRNTLMVVHHIILIFALFPALVYYSGLVLLLILYLLLRSDVPNKSEKTAKSHIGCQRLAFHGIMGDKLRAPLIEGPL